MKHSRFRISDHAIVRYLERVRGLDMKEVRTEISEAVEAAEEHPTCGGVVRDGHVFKLRGDTVTTVVPTGHPDQRFGRKAKK